MAAVAEGGRSSGVGRPGVRIPKQEDEGLPVGPTGPTVAAKGSRSHSGGKNPPTPSPGPGGGGSRRRRGRRKYSDILYTEAEGDGDLDRCSSSDG